MSSLYRKCCFAGIGVGETLGNRRHSSHFAASVESRIFNRLESPQNVNQGHRTPALDFADALLASIGCREGVSLVFESNKQNHLVLFLRRSQLGVITWGVIVYLWNRVWVENELPIMSPQVFHILLALTAGDQHGYAIMQDVGTRTDGKLRLSPGTLYGSVKRMLEQGLVIELRQNERPEDDDERRRYYRLTQSGRKAIKAEVARMAALVDHARAYGLAPKRN
jgi:DNA-binding PadR family transcriptional regulator